MKLFENGVGRPSNEILKKRKNFKIIIAVIVVLFVIAAGFTTYKLFKEDLNANNKNASVNCNYPFFKSKCNGVKNNTVKKIQEVLWQDKYLTKYYKIKSSAVDGIFGSNTEKAVK